MARKVIYAGRRFQIAFARDAAGRFPGEEFFDSLDKASQAKVMALFQIAGDLGSFQNPEKFGDLGGGLFEFKSFQIRMPFGYAAKPERGVIVISHGFYKKKDKTPKEEIERARRILDEDRAQPTLGIVRKAKS
jgi:phage-related protein